MRVTFILPGRGGGGGAHSVVQESCGLRRLGVEVAVAASADTFGDFSTTYPELAREGVATPLFRDSGDLATALAGSDLAVATVAPSAHLLAKTLKAMGETAPRAAYYVQDYEPLFFVPGTREWQAARESYEVLPNALLFAKTDWLCWIVGRNHDRSPLRVRASIDHATYHPGPPRKAGELSITAMIRPKTPRRAPQRTARIMARLAAELGANVKLTTFGCEMEELEGAGLMLSNGVTHLGRLSRLEVADTLRSSDLFLDLSDYQAFGRTGLEGMACGCVPVLPLFGGTREYARHRVNAFVVDTRSDEAILEAVREFAADNGAIRAQMRQEALRTALDYSIEKAAFSEYEAFQRHIS